LNNWEHGVSLFFFFFFFSFFFFEYPISSYCWRDEYFWSLYDHELNVRIYFGRNGCRFRSGIPTFYLMEDHTWNGILSNEQKLNPTQNRLEQQ
jgi:hypothetical protein